MALIAKLITSKKSNRGVFLQQNVSTENVPYSYLKIPLYVTNKGVSIIDIVGSQVIYAFQKKNDSFSIGKIRFTKLIKKGKKKGFYIKGKFIEI